LKLNVPDVNLLLKNYNAEPRSLNTLRNRGRQLKNARNEEERNEIRRQIKEYLNGLKLLNNKNKQNIINKNLPYNNAKAEGNKIQEFKRIAKRSAERKTLTNAVKNLPNSDQKNLLNKFNKRNVTLNSMLNEAKDLKVKRITEKRARERTELYNALNGLNLNVTDRNTIMNTFNHSNMTVNDLKNEAVKLRNARIAQKRAQNRSELEAILDGTNLNASNKTSILNMFNANKNATLTSLRATIEELSKRRKTEKRLATRVEVERYLQKIGLSNANTKMVLNKFNADNKISLKDASDEANAILIQRVMEKMAQNRENLVQHMNGLNISNANRAAILKNFESEAANLNTLKKRATNINVAVKTKAAQRKELSNYINGLGINGTNLLNKLNNGSSTLEKLKKDALKIRQVANAQLVNAKKDDLRAYLKETRLTNTNKKSFINRVETNTNMNAIKREIRELNSTLKSRNDEVARKKTELSTYLNGLNDLTPDQRKGLIKKVVNANTNIQPLKNEGNSLNKAVKNKREEQKRLNEEKRLKDAEAKKLQDEKKLEKHLRSLKHLTSKEMEGYMTDFKNGEALIDDLIAVSKAKNTDNEKDKDAIRNYVRKAVIPQFKKDVYLKQLNTPYVNATPIKGLVNANVAAEKTAIEKLIRNVEIKLKTFTNITSDERFMFKNRLKTEPYKKVLEEAQKLNSNRKGARAAKNKQTKNVAESLRVLTTLTRENRKRFMNRLPQNGAQRVVSNAVALNSERKNAIRKAESNKKIEDEKRRLEEEAQKRRNIEEARLKQIRDQKIKSVASTLQGLTSLERENRKKFMNRLATNGANKVIANATTLNREKKNTAKKTREGVEWKLKKIGVKGSNLQALMKRWNDSKNQTIFDDARKKVEKQMAKQPLLNKVVREIPGALGQWRRGWEDAIRKAETPEELQRLDRLLDQKASLRKEIEKAPIAEDKRRGQLRFVMQMRNDVEKRRQELARDIKAKRDAGDIATRETAERFQSMNKLGRDNRKRFMNRLAGGENARKVLTNADKLQRDRTAKQRVEAERKDREQKQAQERREREQKTREYEKQKQAKLRSNTAKMLQGMSGLERKNRQEFMQRLERGEEPSRVISNAQRRDASKRVRPTMGPQPQARAQPLGRVAPRTKKMKAKNRTRAQVIKQQQFRRR